MSDTEQALARLRTVVHPVLLDPRCLHFAIVGQADIAIALDEITRLRAAVPATCATCPYHSELLNLRLRVANQRQEIARLIASNDRLQATVATTRAAGYEAGQRAMRERAASRMRCPCWAPEFDGCSTPRQCFETAPDEIRALSICQEPDRSQTGPATGAGSEPKP